MGDNLDAHWNPATGPCRVTPARHATRPCVVMTMACCDLIVTITLVGRYTDPDDGDGDTSSDFDGDDLDLDLGLDTPPISPEGTSDGPDFGRMLGQVQNHVGHARGY